MNFSVKSNNILKRAYKKLPAGSSCKHDDRLTVKAIILIIVNSSNYYFAVYFFAADAAFRRSARALSKAFTVSFNILSESVASIAALYTSFVALYRSP